MKTKNIQQEILLMTKSTFSKRQLCEKDDSDKNRCLSSDEQLEQACWDGLLSDFLPGIILKSVTGKDLYPWQIRHCSSFLEIELCEQPAEINECFSVDPYLFLTTINNN